MILHLNVRNINTKSYSMNCRFCKYHLQRLICPRYYKVIMNHQQPSLCSIVNKCVNSHQHEIIWYST
jgi:hypothetical protein